MTGSSCVTGASDPIARVATTNSVTFPASAIVDSPKAPGQTRAENSPVRASANRVATAERSRGTHRTTTAPATTTVPATTSATGPGSNTENASGCASSTVRPTTTSTIWPANRSRTTARADRATAPTARPCPTARPTSPSTPVGRTVLRNVDW